MIKINCLILITGLSLLLSGCNKDVEIKPQFKISKVRMKLLHMIIAVFLRNNLKGIKFLKNNWIKSLLIKNLF